ncbi:uncharacterized protein PG986_008436 [Apiospora aurea]|uniref:Uncharacterized protein n=1 Tax=Apiospora aurea TaxID=335848 RepID=A0ABR1QFE0_9PEZI
MVPTSTTRGFGPDTFPRATKFCRVPEPAMTGPILVASALLSKAIPWNVLTDSPSFQPPVSDILGMPFLAPRRFAVWTDHQHQYAFDEGTTDGITSLRTRASNTQKAVDSAPVSGCEAILPRQLQQLITLPEPQ